MNSFLSTDGVPGILDYKTIKEFERVWEMSILFSDGNVSGSIPMSHLIRKPPTIVVNDQLSFVHSLHLLDWCQKQLQNSLIQGSSNGEAILKVNAHTHSGVQDERSWSWNSPSSTGSSLSDPSLRHFLSDACQVATSEEVALILEFCTESSGLEKKQSGLTFWIYSVDLSSMGEYLVVAKVRASYNHLEEFTMQGSVKSIEALWSNDSLFDLTEFMEFDETTPIVEQYMDQAKEVIDFIDEGNLDILCSYYVRGETLVSIGNRFGCSDSYVAARRDSAMEELEDLLHQLDLDEIVPAGNWTLDASVLKTAIPQMFEVLDKWLYQVSIFDLLVLGRFVKLTSRNPMQISSRSVSRPSLLER